MAAHSLRAVYQKARLPSGEVIVATAGLNQYRSVWARDFGFAANGILRLGDTQVVRDTLSAFCFFQQPDGLFPHILDTLPWWLRVSAASLGIRLPFAGTLRAYNTNQHGTKAIDSGLMLLHAARRYGEVAGEIDFIDRHYEQFKRGLMFYETLLDNGLVAQPPCSDFQDTVMARRGKVFFTNLLYWNAQRALAYLADLTGKPDDAFYWKNQAQHLEGLIFKQFWLDDAGYFANTAQSRQFSTDGNLFAVVFGFADEKQSRSILSAMERLYVWTDCGPHGVVPVYRNQEKEFYLPLIGLGAYHDDYVWLWQTALAAAACHRCGYDSKAEFLLEQIGRMLLRDGAAGEVYEPSTGLPVRRLLYRSEAPFAWSSAMILEALNC